MASIVFISTMGAYPWGGSEELWSQSALRLVESGWRVGACVPFWDPPHAKTLRLVTQGIEMHLRQPVTLSLWRRRWRRLVRRHQEYSAQSRAQDWVLGFRPNLVCISQGRNSDGLDWMLWCREQGIPFVSVSQANFEIFWPPDAEAERLRVASRAARACCFVSEANRRLFELQVGEVLVNARIVRNPCNLPHQQAALRWPDEAAGWKLACVARLEPAAKGQDLLLQVLARPQWRERPAEVSFYGAGPWEQSLRRLAERLDLKNVRFHGHVTDLAAVWERNHLLVLPSRYEGLPLALVEAMWCGRAAVVTDAGGNAEMCSDGETGFVASAAAAGILEQALERAWDRRHEWQFMGQAARRRVAQLIPKDPVSDFCEQLTGWA